MPLTSGTPAIPYNPENYVLPSKVSAWFASYDENGVLCPFRELGNVMEVSAELTEEYLDHESFRKGVQNIDRSLISKVTGSIKLTMDEVVKNNIDVIFKPESATVLTDAQVYEQVTVQFGLKGEYVDITNATREFNTTLDWLEINITEILERDGTTHTYADVDDSPTLEHFVFDNGQTPTNPPRVAINPDYVGAHDLENSVFTITYYVERPGTEYSIQDGISLEGALRLQMLSTSGPQGIFTFSRVVAKIAGPIAISPTDFFKVPMDFAVLTDTTGSRGTYTQLDTFPRFIVGSC